MKVGREVLAVTKGHSIPATFLETIFLNGSYITCQKELDFYVHILLLGSWRDGLGFNALIHAHRPDIIDYNSLVAKNHIHNLNNAFNVAHDELGIAKILDAEGELSKRCFLFVS